MTRVLILEKFAQDYADALRPAFPDLDIHTATSVESANVDYATMDVLVAFGMGINDALFASMKQLKWVQSLATGVDHFLRSKTLRPDVLLTSGRGIHGPAMRETVVHLMLSIGHDSNRTVGDKAARRWDRRPWSLLSGKTAVVVGTGVSGSAIGTLLQAFGMRVIGVSRTPRQTEGFDTVVAQGTLPDVASQADYLVNVLPGDAANRQLIGASIFSRMKSNAYFINVGRGKQSMKLR